MLESFKHYGIFLVIALIVASVLLSNRAGVNLTHHHNLPQLLQKNKVYCSGVIFRHCSVRLTTEITKPEDYQEVLQVLTDASRFDTVTFYFIGGGGQGSSMIQIINALKITKAYTVSVVQGDVQSAHAGIAIATNKLEVGDYLFFMFHRSSLYGNEKEFCDRFKGKKDRTQDLEAKCWNTVKAMTKIDNDITDKLYSKYLTKDEMHQVKNGYDVIVSGEEMKKRQQEKGL